ncbi:class I SAM-dependent methyltransferase [Desulfonatronospira sp.]|uniref:class I SAM-dependent methyltransferase n=1 Tax=Desulfonatronospira sp. TaxID=1962951 RepID=UPI0025BB571B|nr:class I SAM-dependent methyltransferase [Desulfonatronospira sp.]
MDKKYWKDIMLEAAEIDFKEPLPVPDEEFLNVWSSHYAAVSRLTRPGNKILEMGTGYAVLAAGLGRQSGSRVLGLEHPSRAYFFSEEYLDFLRRSNVTLVGADFREGLPLRPESVSQVYCCDVLEHLEPDLAVQILFEINRVLTSDGELILSTPNLNRFSNMIRLLKGHTVNPPIDCGRYGRTCGHIREFSPLEMYTFLQRAGFNTLRFRYELNPFFTAHAFGNDNVWSNSQAGWINRLTRLSYLVFPRLGDEMYILARKDKAVKA